MKTEDIDWKIYHMITAKGETEISCLTRECGMEEDIVIDSIKRLEKSCLISIKEENVRVLSLNEMLLKNQIINTVTKNDSPVIIENGIIKENPNYKR
ncbi:MarR family transcriptional regulator [Methanoplanus sp. FWC-SCC4]|uniref:MarR family transcriptional regulator n=1 Tax=Methanochimaera problematica TaxID=2609417 RepID=A0AA97I3G9_9EURY|nr:MarR family transcriptional regulator [Methanoplanus sp. FWC-SCC4]WOF15881.1 MarR family transcriptional regulator [Methanoplanus sp. FWC-SCC4]